MKKSLTFALAIVIAIIATFANAKAQTKEFEFPVKESEFAKL